MKIEFNHTNLASEFEDMDSYNYIIRDEIKKILQKIEERIENGDSYGSVMDINGNKIGTWSID